MYQHSTPVFDLTDEGRYLIRTDAHCHILPGVDDGSRNMAMSLAMARRAVAVGVEASVATPHACHPANSGFEAPEIRALVKQLNSRLVEEHIQLKVFPGMECLLGEELPELFEAGRILTWADQGRYILLELGFHECHESTPEVIDYFLHRNITPIVAHPERYTWLTSSGRIFRWLNELGCFFQVNVMSINGNWGGRAQSSALSIMRESPNWLVATDSHGPDERFWDLEGVRDVLSTNALWTGQGHLHPGEPPTHQRQTGT